jgi:hypothetical protein
VATQRRPSTPSSAKTPVLPGKDARGAGDTCQNNTRVNTTLETRVIPTQGTRVNTVDDTLGNNLGEPEVSNLDMPAAIRPAVDKQHILQLEVAVHYVALVAVLHGRQDLVHYVHDVGLAQFHRRPSLRRNQRPHSCSSSPATSAPRA